MEDDLDTFLTECNTEITDEIRERTLEYINTGTLPLSDEALNEVAGGRKMPSDRIKNPSDRTSSSYRLRRAQEVAENNSISDKLRSQIRGLDEAHKNNDSTIILEGTGGMQEIQEIMQKNREILVQVSVTLDPVEDAVNYDGYMMERENQASRTGYSSK